MPTVDVTPPIESRPDRPRTTKAYNQRLISHSVCGCDVYEWISKADEHIRPFYKVKRCALHAAANRLDQTLLMVQTYLIGIEQLPGIAGGRHTEILEAITAAHEATQTTQISSLTEG